MGYFGALKSPGGFVNGDVSSAMQKAIRRGDVEGALFWATEFEIGGYGNYVWERLRIIASEDVGLADPEVVILTRTLYENWEQRVDKEKKAAKAGHPIPRESVQFILHAVWALALAKKHRGVDHAVMVFYHSDRSKIPTCANGIPDHVYDMHTAKGKQMGRGVRHFIEVSSKLVNRAKIDDPFEKPGHKAMYEHPVYGDAAVKPEFAPVKTNSHNGCTHCGQELPIQADLEAGLLAAAGEVAAGGDQRLWSERSPSGGGTLATEPAPNGKGRGKKTA